MSALELTEKLATDLGMGWFSVELEDADGEVKVTPTNARSFIADCAGTHGDGNAALYPFASILAALDTLPAKARTAWLKTMCKSAKSELRSIGAE